MADVADAESATVNVGVSTGVTALDAADVLTVRVTAEGDPTRVVTQQLSRDMNVSVVTDEANPPAPAVVSVEVSALLPASSLEVSLCVDDGDGTGEHVLVGGDGASWSA